MTTPTLTNNLSCLFHSYALASSADTHMGSGNENSYSSIPRALGSLSLETLGKRNRKRKDGLTSLEPSTRRGFNFSVCLCPCRSFLAGPNLGKKLLQIRQQTLPRASPG